MISCSQLDSRRPRTASMPRTPNHRPIGPTRLKRGPGCPPKPLRRKRMLLSQMRHLIATPRTKPANTRERHVAFDCAYRMLISQRVG